MSREKKKDRVVAFPVQDVRYAQEHLIASAGLLYAIQHQYAHEGVLSTGAVLHVAHVVDDVIARMGLAEMDIDQQLTPF